MLSSFEIWGLGFGVGGFCEAAIEIPRSSGAHVWIQPGQGFGTGICGVKVMSREILSDAAIEILQSSDTLTWFGVCDLLYKSKGLKRMIYPPGGLVVGSRDSFRCCYRDLAQFWYPHLV